MDSRTIQKIAAARSAPHLGSKSECFWGDKEWLQNLGVSAEVFFATTFGLPYDWERATQQPKGDGGIDFEIPLFGWERPLIIDVKGSSSAPYGLLVNAVQYRRRPPPDIYVGVGFTKSRHGFFTGWFPGREMGRKPIRDFGHGPGAEAHLCERYELRPMIDFCTLLALRTDLNYAGPR